MSVFNFNTGIDTLETPLIVLFIAFSIDNSGNIIITNGKNVVSIVQQDPGLYVITFKDSYAAFYGGNVLMKYISNGSPVIGCVGNGTASTLPIWTLDMSRNPQSLLATSQVYVTAFVGKCTTRTIP